MQPTKIDICNDTLKAPPGTDIGDLPIFRQTDTVTSFWTPDAEEIRRINSGAPISLTVMGVTHPPLGLGVTLEDLPNDNCQPVAESPPKVKFCQNCFTSKAGPSVCCECYEKDMSAYRDKVKAMEAELKAAKAKGDMHHNAALHWQNMTREALQLPASLLVPDLRNRAINAVLLERMKQDDKWGEQNHDPITWAAILTEECGEFAQAALHRMFQGPKADGLRNEAVQCAAGALAIIECLDRNGIS